MLGFRAGGVAPGTGGPRRRRVSPGSSLLLWWIGDLRGLFSVDNGLLRTGLYRYSGLGTVGNGLGY